MKIKTGKKYQTRDGNVYGPMRVDPKYPDRFTDQYGNWYGEDGRYFGQPPGCQFSLVAESPPPEEVGGQR